MIEFRCRHCDNSFAVSDELAGRDGWCRVCKRLVIVPSVDGSGPTWDDLTLSEQCGRLDRMLRYATEKADRLKLLLSTHYAEDGEPISAKIGAYYAKSKKQFKQRIEAASAKTNRLTEELSASIQARDQAERERDRLNRQVEQLAGELEYIRQDSAFAAQALESTKAECERLEKEVERLHARLKGAEPVAPVCYETDLLGKENARLREDLDAAQTAVVEMDVLRREILSLDAKGNELENEKTSAQEKLLTAQAEIDQLRREMAARADASEEMSFGDLRFPGSRAAPCDEHQPHPETSEEPVTVASATEEEPGHDLPREDWREESGQNDARDGHLAVPMEAEFQQAGEASVSATVVFDDETTSHRDPIVESYLHFLDSE